MAKRKQAKNRKQIKRTTRHFQLRVDHPKDMHVREVLDYARSQRREVTMIRDAVTLYYALENGNLEMLFEMFPTFKASFAAPGHSDLAKEIAAQIILQGGAPAYPTEPKSTGGQLPGFKALDAPAFEDDDLLELTTVKASGMDVLNNFMGMAKSLQAQPPKATAKKAAPVSADEIADNFLSMFG